MVNRNDSLLDDQKWERKDDQGGKKIESKQDAEEALRELRSTVEKSVQDALDKAKIKEITKAFDEMEEKNQKLTIEKEEQRKKEIERDDRIKELERQLSEPGNGRGDQEKEAYKKELVDLRKFMRTDEKTLRPDDVKTLRTDQETAGGFLVPNQMAMEILKDITEITPLRRIAQVRNMSAKTLEIPVRASLVASEWEGEAEQDTRSNSTYGLKKVPVYKLKVTVPVTIEELQDAAFNIEAEINKDVVEEYARKEGIAFINGTGSKQPEGILVNGDVGHYASGTSGAITADSIIEITGQVKTGYSPVFLFNRLTRAKIMTLKDGNGRYLWTPGQLAAGIPSQLVGFDYIETPDMDNIGVDTFPIAFGDFKRGYLIGDRVGMSVIRDQYTRKREDIVEFTFMKRSGGQVIKPEAIKKLKCSAS